MRDLAGQPDLALEALEVLGRAMHDVAGQGLDGHHFVELRIGGAVDDAHPAAADDLFDAIAIGEERSRLQVLHRHHRRRGEARLGTVDAQCVRGRGAAHRAHHARGQADQRHRGDR